MLARCLLLFLLSTAGGADDSWRSQCSLLNDARLAPFALFTQAEVAVLAFYPSIDFAAFRSGRRMEFDITPICFAKGYVGDIAMRVVSGTQRCKVAPLPEDLSNTALFFLRRMPGSETTWELLNGGEFPHREGPEGLLSGSTEAAGSFLRTCGLQRTRIAADARSCSSTECRSYCTYTLPARRNCVKARAEVVRNAPGARLPPDVPPYDVSTRGADSGASARPMGPALLAAVLTVGLKL